MALQEEFEEQGLWLFRYRGTLPLIFLIFGLIIHLRTVINPETYFLLSDTYRIYYQLFCLIMSLFGLVIRAYTVGYSPRNTSGRNVTRQEADLLNTTGIYSVVRHPLYLGNFFMWLGPALLTGHLWFVIAFCFLYWIYYERIMFAEEQFLRKKFGSIYTDWAEKVPAFMVSFKHFEKSGLTFSWKKVLKKEKNGFAAIFIVFFIFDFSGEFIKKANNYNEFFTISCILSIIIYIVLKYLKNRTNLLNEEGR